MIDGTHPYITFMVIQNTTGMYHSSIKNFHPTTLNAHKRQISMSPVGFEPAITARQRPQNHALDSAANGLVSRAVSR
jgi:hypothetical protein